MKKSIIIEYATGERVTAVALPPDFAKWEQATKKPISDFNGMWDILFISHSALKREAGAKPFKPLDIWMESVTDVEVEDADPKAIPEEA